MHVFKLLENSEGRFGLTPPAYRALRKPGVRGAVWFFF